MAKRAVPITTGGEITQSLHWWGVCEAERTMVGVVIPTQLVPLNENKTKNGAQAICEEKAFVHVAPQEVHPT